MNLEQPKMGFIQKMIILGTAAAISFGAGLLYSMSARAEDGGRKPRVVYPKKSEVDFSGTLIEGQLRNPGEFYFQHKPEEKFDSLVKRRKNFHREMLRDVVMTK